MLPQIRLWKTIITEIRVDSFHRHILAGTGILTFVNSSIWAYMLVEQWNQKPNLIIRTTKCFNCWSKFGRHTHLNIQKNELNMLCFTHPIQVFPIFDTIFPSSTDIENFEVINDTKQFTLLVVDQWSAFTIYFTQITS